MLKRDEKCFRDLRNYLDHVPVIETHEHYYRPAQEGFFDSFGYYTSDFLSGAWGKEREAQSLLSGSFAGSEALALFKNLYQKSNKTAYARAWQLGLKECYGIEEINEQTIKEVEGQSKEAGEELYYQKMKEYRIRAKIVNVDIETFMKIVSGEEKEYTEFCRFAFPLPDLHNIHNSSSVQLLESYGRQKIKSLDDYLAAFNSILKKAVDFGIVCFKDQTAYRRSIDYTYPSKGEAENAFNNILYAPRATFSTEQVRSLDDWLFHYFMNRAGKYELPVQVHTGHMAGIKNDIAKTNASHFIPVMELHSDVRFDLFHGNWPYMDEYLFIGKNYPNAVLDLCWVQSIDPVYCHELMQRAVMTVPHSKVMAFGGDTHRIEPAIGYLSLARDNVAFALSELISCGWLDYNEAKKIAADWFFNNPNEYFDLGFEPFVP